MTILSLLAATFTFSATATGVEKGTPIEFVFVGPDSDRNYEALFVLDKPVDEFCRAVEAAGIPRGKPEDLKDCVLWPVGCPVSFEPAISNYLNTAWPDGVQPALPIYTGGTRLPDGACEAATNMPLSAFALYSLPQSPIVFDSHYEQGVVYNSHQAKGGLKKGDRVTFKLSWDEKTKPTHIDLVARPGSAKEILGRLQALSKTGEVDACVDFDPQLTVTEARTIAQALSMVDSPHVKINGFAQGHLYFRAFLPMEKWKDRQERLVQPYELTIGTTNKLVFIDEDWNVEGDDPKLTPHVIPFTDSTHHPKTETCFIYANSNEKLAALYAAMALMKGSNVRTWYVYDVQ